MGARLDDKLFSLGFMQLTERRVKTVRSSSDGRKANLQDIRQVQLMLMRASDIGHTAKTWAVHTAWAEKCQEEFFQQGDEEAHRASPVGGNNKREGFNLGSSQCGFFKFIVVPLWEQIARLDEEQHEGQGYKDIYDACEANLGRWERIRDGHVVT